MSDKPSQARGVLQEGAVTGGAAGASGLVRDFGKISLERHSSENRGELGMSKVKTGRLGDNRTLGGHGRQTKLGARGTAPQ